MLKLEYVQWYYSLIQNHKSTVITFFFAATVLSRGKDKPICFIYPRSCSTILQHDLMHFQGVVAL